MSKPKNSLLVKKVFADLICNIVQEVKDEFANLSIEDVKQDLHFVLFLMEKIDEKSKDKKLMGNVSKEKLDKNGLLIEVVKQLIPKVDKPQLDAINYTMEFILENNMLKKKIL